MIAYKVFTNDLRPPVQGGDPVWSGELPYTLPTVAVDESDDDCGAGWNACADVTTALRIAGLWPNGRPSRVFELDTDNAKVLVRKEKLRAATWNIVRKLSEAEIGAAIALLSTSWFGARAAEMAAAQIDWRHALGRPLCDPAAVEQGLRVALEARGLQWSLKRFESARDVWDAWDAWDAMGARDVWDAWDAWDAMGAWGAWDARAAWGAWAARAALMVQFVAGNGWISYPPQMLTVGIIDAYRNGLAVALPTGPNELGWAMEATP